MPLAGYEKALMKAQLAAKTTPMAIKYARFSSLLGISGSFL
jgi:hypothetical protein